MAAGPPGPTGLPVEDCIDAVRAALAGEGSAVLKAPPGAGKTTVVPLRLLDEAWLEGRRIVVLEPRRLATRAAANRMASLLGEPVGATVGYATRDERVVGPGTRVEVVTEGILTRRLQHDRSLPGTGLVVFDEVHERNLQTDLAMALALAAKSFVRPDLRLLAMSATMDTGPLSRLLGLRGPSAEVGLRGPSAEVGLRGPNAEVGLRGPNAGVGLRGPNAEVGLRGPNAGVGAPVVESEGKQYPVDIRWMPPPPRQPLADATTNAVVRALRAGDGDVLVFLPGAGDIRRVEATLARAGLPDDVDVRALFGALTLAEQDVALAGSPPGRRRVVLATDIAETSLTVEGVRQVVDSGQSRTPRYDARSGLTKLQTGAISRASADQRAGRAGRVAPGTAYRLWSKMEHAGRRPFRPPEIASVDLAGFALELAVWGASVDDLEFLELPPARALDDAAALLVALGALDAAGRPTPEGRAMADLPLHPRLARMVVGARALGLAWEACVLAALLEERDVLRGRPDEVPVDVGERVRLIADRQARHPAADGPAVAGARRRAVDLAHRVTADAGAVDPGALGRVLALAYPDRVAQARTGGRFRLRNGAGAWVPKADPLAVEPFLVVAELDADRRESRVRMAASLDPADVVAAAEAPVQESPSLAWDRKRGDLRASVTRHVDALVLGEVEGPAAPGAAATQALVDRVRSSRLGTLRWSGAARSLQQRAGFLREQFGDPWPDLSDAALLARLDEWLVPRLAGATRRADVEAIDMAKVLRAQLGHEQVGQIDRLAPTAIFTDTGRTLKVEYRNGHPTVPVRVQDLFGSTRHPTVAGGQVPVVFELLSPAGRPVQVTSDLPGFWASSYAAVRKDMAGRYPKHPWPADPTVAPPPRRRRR